MLLNELDDEFKTVVLHNRLNPKLWIGDRLQTAVREALIDIAAEFKKFLNLEDLEVTDLILTGSNAAFSYTDHSDLDLHLVIEGKPSDELRELFNAKKALWAHEHDISIKGLPVELYVQGTEEPHHSNGIYSIKDQTWLKKPSKKKPDINDIAVKAKADDLEVLILKALDSEDRAEAEAIKEKVVKMRKAGIDKAGEWSTENQAFKVLRNKKLIDRLSSHIRKLQDAELSLEQQSNILD